MTTAADAPVRDGMTLREIAGDVLALEDLLFESGGDDTPEIQEWMAENAANMAGKVDGYGTILREWDGRMALLKEEEKRLAERRMTIERSAARLKGWMCLVMGQLGEKKLEGRMYTASRVRNSARGIDLMVGVDALPPEFTKLETVASADRAAIAAAIGKPETDEAVDLMDLAGNVVARMAAAGYHVRIR